MSTTKRAKRPRPRPDASAPIAPAVREILAALGEDPEREGLLKTPSRVEAAYRWMTRGYQQSVREVVGDAVFEDDTHENMVLVRDIEFYSMCEHHLLPFFGKAHVAYIPKGRIVGLSKLPRIVDVFARRLQVQERLTDQMADAVMEVAGAPRGRGADRGGASLHGDARRREAELPHRDQRPARHLPQRRADPDGVSETGACQDVGRVGETER